MQCGTPAYDENATECQISIESEAQSASLFVHNIDK